MRLRVLGAVLAAGIAMTGCGPGAHTTATRQAPVRAVSDVAALPLPAPPRVHRLPAGVPHFDSPEAAMRYLAEAWNQRDEAALRHVTDASARDDLDLMHMEATDLRLRTCDRLSQGDYWCAFTHGYPPERLADQDWVRGNTGQAWFRVGPAKRSGWYMTVLEECG